MTASVAGAVRANRADVSRPDPTQSVRAMFHVSGAADPGLLPRVIEPVAKLGYAPHRVHASREDGDGSEMVVELRLNDVPRRVAQLVEANLRAIVGVRRVIAVVE